MNKRHQLFAIFIFLQISGLLCATTDTNFFARAQQLRHDGKSDEAISYYRRTLSNNPLHFEALFHLANELFYREQYNEAIDLYKQARRINPDNPQMHFNLGIALELQKNIDEAISCFEKAVELSPHYTKALSHLAKAYQQQQKTEKAITLYKKLIDFDSDNTDAYTELGRIMRDQKNFGLAIDYFTKALAFKNNDRYLLFDLGCLCTNVGRTQEAVHFFQEVLKQMPSNVTALYNIGYALKMEGSIRQAIQYYNKALAMQPDYENVYFARARAYLQMGDFEKGWKESERYLKKSGKYAGELRTLLREGKLEGKKIFLTPEGGLGDTLNFIRYAKILKELGATVIVLTQKPLIPLLSRCNYIDTLLPSGSAVPPYHAHATLMSLAAVFCSTEETIPRNFPYIYPDPKLITHWKNQLANNHNFKVGICWQADTFNDSSRPPVAHRGIPLATLYPLSKIKNISLYSLQKNEGLDQLESMPNDFLLHVFDDTFDEKNGSFMDSAAVMMQLDLVITVDTAVAHLAGALGVPVWLLLPYATDWRWLAGRTDTPWYPTMRIFKQPAPFDWESVVRSVLSEITKKLNNHEEKTCCLEQ